MRWFHAFDNLTEDARSHVVPWRKEDWRITFKSTDAARLRAVFPGANGVSAGGTRLLDVVVLRTLVHPPQVRLEHADLTRRPLFGWPNALGFCCAPISRRDSTV